MTQQVLYFVDGDTAVNEGAGKTVPQIMHTHLRHASVSQCIVPSTIHIHKRFTGFEVREDQLVQFAQARNVNL